MPVSVAHQVDHLHNVEDDWHAWYCKHEDDENGLLCGPRNETVSSAEVSTGWRLVAVDVERHEHRAKDVELAHREGHLQEDLENELGHICAEEDALYLHLPSLINVFGLLCYSSISAVLQRLDLSLLLMDNVHSVAQVDQGGCGHKGDLQDPVVDIGDWEHPVIAGMFTTRFLAVTLEIWNFVSPDFVGSSTQDKDPEEEEDAHPDLPYHCGVRLHLVQQSRQIGPVTHRCTLIADREGRNTNGSNIQLKNYKQDQCNIYRLVQLLCLLLIIYYPLCLQHLDKILESQWINSL